MGRTPGDRLASPRRPPERRPQPLSWPGLHQGAAWKSGALVIAVAVTTAACATVPTGPSIMVLPGTGKNFEQFQADNAVCRDWAAQETGTTTKHAATASTVSGAAIGTAVGAAA